MKRSLTLFHYSSLAITSHLLCAATARICFTRYYCVFKKKTRNLRNGNDIVNLCIVFADIYLTQSIVFANIYLFSISFSIDFKSGLPHTAYIVIH